MQLTGIHSDSMPKFFIEILEKLPDQQKLELILWIAKRPSGYHIDRITDVLVFSASQEVLKKFDEFENRENN